MAEPTFDETCDRLDVPDGLRKHIAPESPSRGKIAVARGMLPAPPKVLLNMMYLLLGDSDKRVRRAAQKGILALPEDRMLGLVDRKSHPKLLEFLAYRRLADEALIERIVLFHQTNDKTLCYIAEHGHERVAEMIANNQERLVVTPQLINFLARNPNVPRNVVDRVRSFQRLYGIDMPAIDEAQLEAERVATEQRVAKLKASPDDEAPDPLGSKADDADATADDSLDGSVPDQPLPVAAEPPPPPTSGDLPGMPASPVLVPGQLPDDFVPGEVYVPALPATPYQPPPGLLNPLAGLLQDWGIPLDPRFVAPPANWASDVAGPPIPVPPPAAAAAAPTRDSIDVDSVDLTGMKSLGSSEFVFSMSEDEDVFSGDMTADIDRVDDEKKADLKTQISKMNIGDKIKLAYKGNKPVRELLVRDRNKIVATAVVNSGRITDNEVMAIASNRAIHEDVIRALVRVKEYMRKYPVKVALVNNPKTPISTSISLLKSLHVKDLKTVGSNRNISSAVFGQANKMYKAKKSGQR
jgi:hypothetical protein